MVSIAQVAIFLASAVVAVPLFKRLGLGSVLGYLAAGILIGPAALGLISDVESILHFSEFGVVLLLFIIGLELKPSRLWVMRKAVFGLGGAQVLLTGAAIGLGAWMLGLTPAAAVVIGFGLSMSSTAFVLPILAERDELLTAHGRTSFAILLFQDLAIIPLLALMPLLGVVQTSGAAQSPLVTAVETLVVFAGVIFGGRYLIRPVFRFIATSHNHEIFTATALLIVVGTAALMEEVGMSMTLGAFLAGVLLADSEYRHELQADIEPFKGLLLGLFFIAVGMSANLGLLVEHPLKVLGVVVGFMAVKAGVLLAVGRLSGLDNQQARHVAFALPQGGEFAFVLFSLAISYQIFGRELADLLVVAVTLSMIVTPFLVSLDDRLSRMQKPSEKPEFDTIDETDNPVIIAGFGRFGQIVGRCLRMRRIRFTALEADPAHVESVRRFGNKIYYGDASRLDLLRSAGTEKARAFVLAIDDVEASVRTAETVRKHFPGLPIYARARNRQHAHELMAIGAEVIFRETFLSSLALTQHVLQRVGLSEEAARDSVARFREHDEAALLKQFAIRHDESQLIQSSQQVARELESLFEEDAGPAPLSEGPAAVQ